MKALIVFDDDHAALPGGGRPARHTARKAINEKRRSKVLDQLAEAGLAEGVSLSQASPLSSLLIDGSEQALEVARSQPFVKEVVPMSDAEGGVEIID
jgi:hypothetical protein